MKLKHGGFKLVEEFCFLLGVRGKFGELTNWTKLVFFGFSKERKIKKGEVVVRVWCKVEINCFVYC
jgi:hypothetical protein